MVVVEEIDWTMAKKVVDRNVQLMDTFEKMKNRIVRRFHDDWW